MNKFNVIIQNNVYLALNNLTWKLKIKITWRVINSHNFRKSYSLILTNKMIRYRNLRLNKRHHY